VSDGSTTPIRHPTGRDEEAAMRLKFDLVELGVCVLALGVVSVRVAEQFPSWHRGRSDERAAAGAQHVAEVASAGPVPAAVGVVDPVLAAFGFPAASLLDESPAPPALSGIAALGVCSGDLTAERLNAMLGGHPAGIAGSDYPHVYTLGDARLLWLFQDVFVGSGNSLTGAPLLHNSGFLQIGACVRPLPGTSGVQPSSWLGAEQERPNERWFWPLDGEIGADGNLWVFVAEMRNPNGTGAALGAAPVATWIAVVHPETLEVVRFERAPDDSAALYGWSIVSDDQYSYLYGHCYRQFQANAWLATDPSCSPWTSLARVPRGRFDAPLQYYTASGWSGNPEPAVPVLRGAVVHAASVERFGRTFVSVTKADDWWGHELIVEAASAPEGPWHELAVVPIPARCADCNTYGSFLLPWLEDGNLVVAVSHNAFHMRETVFENASIYRPSIVLVPLPT
jgi:hypothetical protein